MGYKVFIDGQAGTTGLRLAGRLAGRPDIELIEVTEPLRKDLNERLSCIAEADISVLCLPDDSACGIMAAVDEAAGKGGPGSPLAKSRIIDCGAAHRTAEGWIYGMPEIAEINAGAARVANPGCHATGFILAVRPLVDAGVVGRDAALVFHSLTGYSGGGKPMIAQYEAPGRSAADGLSAPRRYGLSQGHKHIPEMQKYSGLGTAPVFAPVVCDYYSGMLTGVPLPRGALRRHASAEEVRGLLAEYYAGCPLIKVRPGGYELSEEAGEGYLSAEAFSNRDDLEIFVTGDDDRIEIVARYDNLGKGASGAAIQCMNLMLGLPEEMGLCLGQ